MLMLRLHDFILEREDEVLRLNKRLAGMSLRRDGMEPPPPGMSAGGNLIMHALLVPPLLYSPCWGTLYSGLSRTLAAPALLAMGTFASLWFILCSCIRFSFANNALLLGTLYSGFGFTLAMPVLLLLSMMCCCRWCYFGIRFTVFVLALLQPWMLYFTLYTCLTRVSALP